MCPNCDETEGGMGDHEPGEAMKNARDKHEFIGGFTVIPKPNPQPVEIEYTNYRGEFSVRRILPLGIHFDEVEWHPGPQWLMEAIDLEKNAQRTFAIKDISAWRAG